MQDNNGKVAHKSEEITAPPTRDDMAAVTPRTTTNGRVQAQAKKAKKKGLEGYFGAGFNTVNLEAIKGSLRKKGSGTPSPKGPINKTDRKKATFAEVAKNLS
jgi:hypothetical protein